VLEQLLILQARIEGSVLRLTISNKMLPTLAIVYKSKCFVQNYVVQYQLNLLSIIGGGGGGLTVGFSHTW
jgi:hypothetical protein